MPTYEAFVFDEGKLVQGKTGENAREFTTQLRRKKYVRLHPSLPKQVRENILKGFVNVGMTSEQAEASWGKPYNINRTTNGFGTSEQWVMSEYRPSYLYFQNGILTTIQN